MKKAVADRVREGGLPDEVVPLSDGELAGQDGRTGAVPVVEEFEEVTAILGNNASSPQSSTSKTSTRASLVSTRR